jgi:hypothetical protein
VGDYSEQTFSTGGQIDDNTERRNVKNKNKKLISKSAG